MALLDVNNLKTFFHTRGGTVRAVDGVSFTLKKGETLGLVGESGCGKSVTCYSLLGLIPKPPGRIEGGQAMFDGVDLLNCSESARRGIRGSRISMIFQDPMTSLNPYLRISTQLIEPLRVHEGLDRKTALDLGVAALADVGIQDPERSIHCYPHEFSGGMRQRVIIAMALITRPEVLIADEPTTALDVTVQAQILELIKDCQRELDTGTIFITHDLGIVAGMCDRVSVMYAGKIVEHGPTEAIYKRPKHPYTVALQRSIPSLHRKGEPLYTIPGQPPDMLEEVRGCAFADRCKFATPRCREPLELRETEPGHATACVRCQENEIDLV